MRLIEKVPGKVSGRPIVRGTRILPDAIVDSYDLGETVDELHEGFPSLSVSQIQRLMNSPRPNDSSITRESGKFSRKRTRHD